MHLVGFSLSLSLSLSCVCVCVCVRDCLLVVIKIPIRGMGQPRRQGGRGCSRRWPVRDGRRMGGKERRGARGAGPWRRVTGSATVLDSTGRAVTGQTIALSISISSLLFLFSQTLGWLGRGIHK